LGVGGKESIETEAEAGEERCFFSARWMGRKMPAPGMEVRK